MQAILQKDDGSSFFPQAIDQLLASKQKEAADLACTIFTKPHGHLSDYTAAPIIQRLFLAGRQEALDDILAELGSTNPSGQTSGEFQGKQVQRQQVTGDAAAEQLARWRTDKYDYPMLAPDDQRTAERERLKTWLTQQFALLRQGKKITLRITPDPIQVAHWQLDAP